MTLQNIDFNKKTLDMQGVRLPSVAFASAVASQIYEGFRPTPKSISIMTDYANGKISIKDLEKIAKNKPYLPQVYNLWLFVQNI